MPDVQYTATIDVPRLDVWNFVKDIDNWAPLAKGYQSHESINNDESIWTVKGDIGPLSRITKFQINITEWLEGEGVTFVMKGLNEPISGHGSIRLTDTEGGGTVIQADAEIQMGGALGPVVNHLIVPWIGAGADELVTNIAQALQPSYEKPTQPSLISRLLASLRRLFGGSDSEPGAGTGDT